MAVAEIFKALGDPVRLEIIRRLSDGSEYTIGHLSKGLGVSRQGARKQIQVLVAADVVQLKPSGRETKVTLEHKSIAMAQAFIKELEDRWEERLQALKTLVEPKE